MSLLFFSSDSLRVSIPPFRLDDVVCMKTVIYPNNLLTTPALTASTREHNYLGNALREVPQIINSQKRDVVFQKETILKKGETFGTRFSNQGVDDNWINRTVPVCSFNFLLLALF